MYRDCLLYKSRQMIKVTMGEVRSLVMFDKVDGKKLCGKDLGIVEMDL